MAFRKIAPAPPPREIVAIPVERLDEDHALGDGSQIAVAGASEETPIYQTETGERAAACKGPRGTYAVAFSSNGEQLATGGFDGKVRIYDVKSGKLVREFVPVPLETQMASAR